MAATHSAAGGLRFYPLLILVLAGALVRVFPLLSGTWSSLDVVMTYTTYDSNRYVVLANELVAGRGFTRSHGDEGPVHKAVEAVRRANGTWRADDSERFAEAFRTPVYPLYLATFGGRPGLHVALLVQCLLGALCAALAAAMAQRIGLSARAAYIVGGVWAFHPAMVTTDMLVLTESLFGMIGLCALAVAVFRPDPAGLLLAGLLIGIDGLVRPLGLIYLVPVLILGWPRSRQMLAVMLCVAAAAAPSMLWAARNAQAGQGFRVSTVGEINLYYYAGSYVLSEARGRDWKQDWPGNIRELSDRLQLAPGEDAFRHMRAEALAIFREHPEATLKVAAKSQIKLMFDHSMGFLLGQYRQDFESTGMFSELMRGRFAAKSLNWTHWASMAWMLLNAALALLATVGLVQFARRQRWRLFFGCLLPVLLFSAASFPVGLERFRVPFMFYLAVPAAACIAPRRD